VGMSQYGARTLALSGYGYAQILGFYYPDTQLQRLTVIAQR
jgi:SpoIID/LytB domain protein